MKKVPSYLKGLAETRARCAADVERFRRLRCEVARHLEAAELDLSAADRLIRKFDERLDGRIAFDNCDIAIEMARVLHRVTHRDKDRSVWLLNEIVVDAPELRLLVHEWLRLSDSDPTRERAREELLHRHHAPVAAVEVAGLCQPRGQPDDGGGGRKPTISVSLAIEGKVWLLFQWLRSASKYRSWPMFAAPNEYSATISWAVAHAMSLRKDASIGARPQRPHVRLLSDETIGSVRLQYQALRGSLGSTR